VPLVYNDNNLLTLSGISFDSEVKTNYQEKIKNVNKTIEKIFKEKTLITHRGFSGPAILQISSYLNNNDKINIKISLEKSINEIVNSNLKSQKELKTILNEFIPSRFVDYIIENRLGVFKIINKPMIQYNHNEIAKIIDIFENWELGINKNEGYEKAEVTVGGVDTKELNQKTMESKLIEGLYLLEKLFILQVGLEDIIFNGLGQVDMLVEKIFNKQISNGNYH
jgi:predicted flavoprotein YhiN